jgi:hypothetical protein
VSDTSLKGEDRAEEQGATAAQSDDFPPDTVLLGRERQSSKGGVGEVREGHGCSGGVKGSNPKLDVFKAEGTGVGSSAHILAQAQKEKESNDNHVSDSVVAGIIRSVGRGNNVV